MRYIDFSVDAAGRISEPHETNLSRAGEINAATLRIDVSAWAAAIETGVLYAVKIVRGDGAEYVMIAGATPANGVLTVPVDDTAAHVAGSVKLQVIAEKTDYRALTDVAYLGVNGGISGSTPDDSATWVEALTGAANAATEAAAALAAKVVAAGDWGEIAVDVETLEPGAEATASLTQAEGLSTFAFGIPRGNTGGTGATGGQGPQGPAGGNITTAAQLPTADGGNVEAKLDAHASQLADIADAAIPAYGVSYAGGSNVALTRILNAAGLVVSARVGIDPAPANPFSDIEPWASMLRCNLSDAGVVTAFQGDPTFAQDGSNGQVMVRVPKFWYKLTPVSATNAVYHVGVCGQAKAGYTVHPAFAGRKADGGDLDAIYVGAYDAGIDGGGTKLTSVSGAFPRVNATRADFRTKARARGTNWAQMDFLAASALQLLYLIEFAGWDGQALIGQGLTGLPYTATHLATVATNNSNDAIMATSNAGTYDVGMVIGIGTTQGGNQIAANRVITAKAAYDGTNTRITFDGAPINVAIGNMLYAVGQKTGRADALGGKTGREAGAANERSAMVYRGIENLWGNVWTWIDGLNIKDYAWYATENPDNYADDVFAGAYTQLTGTAPNADGYVKTMHLGDHTFRPSAVGGGTGTYMPDYYYQASGNRVLALGGFFNYGATAGPFSWYAISSSGSAYVSFGGRLLYLPR